MNLYRKYRPKEFSEMMGNESSIESLQKSILKKNHSHSYLFFGPPGTGKTTAARIMAYTLGAGELDIREVNSSSNRGIDTAREIIDQIRMMPIEGVCSVFIMDECHKWTNDFQNAILKPLEDTPEHVYFFLCTTDPQKLIKAIRSRCTEIKFDLLSEEDIMSLVRRVKKKEQMEISSEVIEEIATASQGSPRNALVMLEGIMSIEKEEDQLKYIHQSQIGEDDIGVIELCRMLLNQKSDWSDVASILKKLGEEGKLSDSESIRYAVLGYMNSVLMGGKKIERAISALEAFSEPTYNNGKFGITLACLNTIL